MNKYLSIFLLFFSGQIYSQTNTNESLFENLKINDTLTIQYSSVGEYDQMCGVTKKSYMKFFFDNNQLVAQTLKDGKIIRAEIDNSKKEFLINLEKESHSVDGRENVCKHSDGYIFYLNRESKFRIIDQTCNWFGFSKMTEKLFGYNFK
jgi:hypothetical protein